MPPGTPRAGQREAEGPKSVEERLGTQLGAGQVPDEQRVRLRGHPVALVPAVEVPEEEKKKAKKLNASPASRQASTAYCALSKGIEMCYGH